MTRTDHEDAYARCCRDAEARWRWEGLWLPMLRTLAWGLALAALLWMAAAAGDCGDMAHADPEPLPEAHPAASQRIPAAPDAEAFALASRLAAWQPTWRPVREGELEAVAVAIVTACRRDPWPTPERCPDLLGALAFRESSFRANAIGARGEVGLFQLLPGVALAGETRASALDPEVNARLALAHLRRSESLCTLAGRPGVSVALGMYGSGRCRAYRGSRLLERWEAEVRAAGGQS